MRTFVFILFLVFGVTLTAQVEDPVLFKVNDRPVHLSEFNYIYNKNNGDKADYSSASVEEYLDLYVKFKLKVEKAREMKLDTIVSLQKELAGYRKQLANAYLVDREVSKNLVDEAHERQKTDIRVAHILLMVPEKASAEQEKSILARAQSLKNQLNQGADFETLAKSQSDDKSSSDKGGKLNWMTSMLSDGFYHFESAAYGLKMNEISDPVRSKLGYHIIKRIDTREARGQLEVAHILIRTRKGGQEIANAKERIDSIYTALQMGANFESLCSLSDDRNTKEKGGSLGYFGISQFELAFENAAFALINDGTYSKPIKTSIGWHIIKRLSRKDVTDVEAIKSQLKTQIAKKDRFEIARKGMLKAIKKQAGYQEQRVVLDAFAKSLDESFYSYKWQAPRMGKQMLCSFGSQYQHGIQDFADYCKASTRVRLRFNKNKPITEAVDELFEDFVEQKTLDYEEANLEKKYPDFKSLMREYSEGILLFEATKLNVWDKASRDTIGLTEFYEKNKSRYYWKQRGVVKTYTVNSTDQKVVNKIWKDILSKKNSRKVLNAHNKDEKLITVDSDTYEVGSKEFFGLEWKEGSTTNAVRDQANGTSTIKSLEKLLPETTKSMSEARGYIIADYQDELEKKWVKGLREKFPVEVNEKVLKSIIKA